MKKKTKIYLYNPYPAIGGVDTTIKRLLFSLDRSYEIEYLSLKKAENYKRKNIKNTVIKSSSTLRSFFQIYKIFKNDKHKNKIFISIQYFVNIWSIIFIKLLLNGKLLIYEVNHIDEFKYFKNFTDYIKKKIMKILIKFLYRYPDIIIANSKELSLDLSKYIKRKIYTLYNPCFEKIKNKKKFYKAKNKIKILNISRFENQKDHLTLLKAIGISTIKDKIDLILVGYGSNQQRIKDFIAQNKINAKIYINESKIDKFYKKANLYVCPSLYEGLPTTVIEAASNCVPIISSNFKSGSAEIFMNGKGGYIFNKGDFKTLSKLFLQFYNNPKFFFKKEIICRKNLKRFEIKKNTDLFKNYLKKLI